MNRAERRKVGIKGKAKTYVFKSKDDIVKAATQGVAKDAMMEEIDRQILERVDRMESDLDAAMLWALHVSCGFGVKRLEKFYRDRVAVYREMRARFLDSDCYAEKMKLYEMGLDLEKLRKEVEKDDLLQP